VHTLKLIHSLISYTILIYIPLYITLSLTLCIHCKTIEVFYCHQFDYVVNVHDGIESLSKWFHHCFKAFHILVLTFTWINSKIEEWLHKCVIKGNVNSLAVHNAVGQDLSHNIHHFSIHRSDFAFSVDSSFATFCCCEQWVGWASHKSFNSFEKSLIQTNVLCFFVFFRNSVFSGCT